MHRETGRVINNASIMAQSISTLNDDIHYRRDSYLKTLVSLVSDPRHANYPSGRPYHRVHSGATAAATRRSL
jgi:hypothetical protein